jgi:hypothetical protein
MKNAIALSVIIVVVSISACSMDYWMPSTEKSKTEKRQEELLKQNVEQQKRIANALERIAAMIEIEQRGKK